MHLFSGNLIRILCEHGWKTLALVRLYQTDAEELSTGDLVVTGGLGLGFSYKGETRPK